MSTLDPLIELELGLQGVLTRCESTIEFNQEDGSSVQEDGSYAMQYDLEVGNGFDLDDINDDKTNSFSEESLKLSRKIVRIWKTAIVMFAVLAYLQTIRHRSFILNEDLQEVVVADTTVNSMEPHEETSTEIESVILPSGQDLISPVDVSTSADRLQADSLESLSYLGTPAQEHQINVIPVKIYTSTTRTINEGRNSIRVKSSTDSVIKKLNRSNTFWFRSFIHMYDVLEELVNNNAESILL